MRILLTGADGQLGRAIQSTFNTEDLILTDSCPSNNIHPLDITDLDEVMNVVRDCNPDTIINCAAMTNVDGCEINPTAAYQTNAIGPRNLAIVCNELNKELIHISTDYVFSGCENIPRNEFDLTRPLSVYGKSKLEGENFIKSLCNKYFIIRTAWLYGDGHNFVKTMLKLAETHSEVCVVNDQFGSPTSTLELARVIKMLSHTEHYGTYHATCEGTTTWAQFAQTIFETFNKGIEVELITSEEYKSLYPQSASRPYYSVLDNWMLRNVLNYKMKTWKEAFIEYTDSLR